MESKTAQRVREEQVTENTGVPQNDAYSGFGADTIILTMKGETRARDLLPGDRVITRDAGMSVLRDVRHARVTCDVVHIKAGSLGHNRPGDDVFLPCTSRLLIRDWRAKALFGHKQAMIAAQELQDGEFVKLVKAQTIDVVDLVFDKPHIVYASGLEVACETIA